ncbi:MAG: hypothetical protein SGILL_002431 [Bacillariaceae sp.]
MEESPDLSKIKEQGEVDDTLRGVAEDSIPTDMKEDVFRLVRVPANDEFKIDDAVRQLGIATERSEIYASHSFMYSAESTKGMLRSNSQEGSYADELFNELKKAVSKKRNAEVRTGQDQQPNTKRAAT